MVPVCRYVTCYASVRLCICRRRGKHFTHIIDFLQFPEHTLESYEAAVIQGAGIVECDVTFTKDRELVCRHSQCDLHTTTDVVMRPDMNAKCTTPWMPGTSPSCCASDFTLAEIKTLCAKMDYADSTAGTAEEYVYGNVSYLRTDLYGRECHAVPTHAESIELGVKHGIKFTPELKSAAVEMPYEGDYTQEDYAQQMIDEYIYHGVHPMNVWPQSFDWGDVNYWVTSTDFFQAVALEGNYALLPADYDAQFAKLDEHVMYYAPPTQMLLALDSHDNIVASDLANYANSAGYHIITWTIERSEPLSSTDGGFYYGTTGEVLMADGDIFTTLYALDKEVGVVGVFSDWPATTTFYANCMGL